MNLKTISLVYGVLFLLLGMLGFVPGVTTDGMIFGVFEVNTLHNVIFLVTGVAGLLAGMKGNMAKMYLMLVGVVYLLLAVLGFLTDGDLSIVSVNMADNVLHGVAGVVALLAAFMMKDSSAMMETPSGDMDEMQSTEGVQPGEMADMPAADEMGGNTEGSMEEKEE